MFNILNRMTRSFLIITTIVFVSFYLLSFPVLSNSELGGFAELKIINKYGNPVPRVNISLVRNNSIVYSSTTGNAGVVQWSRKRIPEGYYILRIRKGSYYMSMGLNMKYRKFGWVTLRHKINR